MADSMTDGEEDFYAPSEANSGSMQKPENETKSLEPSEPPKPSDDQPTLPVPNTDAADNLGLDDGSKATPIVPSVPEIGAVQMQTRPAQDLVSDSTLPISDESKSHDISRLQIVGNERLQAAAAQSVQETAAAPDDAEGALANNSSTDKAENGLSDAGQPRGPEGPEYEADSSPYESSDESSSDSSSDEDSSDDEYRLLDPREQARMLMADAGSDDEGGKKEGKGNGPRTQNEQFDEIVEMPKLEITPEMKIEELGNVQIVVDNVALIKAKTSGEYQVLESSSVLCLEDRKLIGVVAETIGRVEEPMYVVRFTNPATLLELGIEVGKTIFYVPSHSHFLFTKALQVKGSDASNLHDEEVAVNEMDFSDDEAEAAYKSSLKKQRQAKKEGRPGAVAGAGRGGGGGLGGNHRNANTQRSAGPASNGPTELSYDDAGTNDDLYTPLSRPAVMMQGDNFQRTPPTASGWQPRGGGRGRGRGGGHFNRGRGGQNSGRGGGGGGGGGGFAQNQSPPGPQPGAYQASAYNFPPHLPHPAAAAATAAPGGFSQGMQSSFNPYLNQQQQQMPAYPQQFLGGFNYPHLQQQQQQPQQAGLNLSAMPQFSAAATIPPPGTQAAQNFYYPGQPPYPPQDPRLQGHFHQQGPQ